MVERDVDVRETVTVEVRRSILRAAEEFAARECVTLDEFVARAVVERIARDGASAVFTEKAEGADAERAARWLEGRPEAG
jgi:hypothetical protein